MKKLTLLVLFGVLSYFSKAQKLPVQEGLYRGKMYMYRQGVINDSVWVELKIKALLKDSCWTWETKYLSEKLPLTKAYKLLTKDVTKGFYTTDEGDEIFLYDFLFGNKLYSQFETHETLLTSSYEWLEKNRIVFEVTSAKKEKETPQGISNYKINHLQRVVFDKVD